MASVLVDSLGMFKCTYIYNTYICYLPFVGDFSYPCVVNSLDHFAPGKNIMTLSICMKIFHFLLLPEAIMSFQLLQKFRKLKNFDGQSLWKFSVLKLSLIWEEKHTNTLPHFDSFFPSFNHSFVLSIYLILWGHWFSF